MTEVTVMIVMSPLVLTQLTHAAAGAGDGIEHLTSAITHNTATSNTLQTLSRYN